jgi:hypothetical protein
MSSGVIANARRCERIFVKMPVSLLVESQGTKIAHEASTVDFSQRGVRVKSRVPLWPGQNIELIPSGSPRCSVPGRVIWVHATSANRAGEAGLEFLQPLPAEV